MAAPSSGFDPFSGTSGDFQCVLLTDDPNVDFQIIPATKPAVTTMLGSVKWQLSPNGLDSPEFIGHNSPTNSTGAMYPLQIKGGKVTWGIKLDQIMDGNPASGQASAVRLPLSCFIYFQLLFHRSQRYGYDGYAKIVKFEPGASDPEQNQKPVGLSIELKGHGALPTPSFLA